MTTNSRRRIVRKRVGSRVPAAHLSDERRGPRWRAGTTHCADASFENGLVRESRRRTCREPQHRRQGLALSTQPSGGNGCASRSTYDRGRSLRRHSFLGSSQTESFP